MTRNNGDKLRIFFPKGNVAKAIITENNLDAIVVDMKDDYGLLRFKNVQDFIKAINGEKKVIALEKEKQLRKFYQILQIVTVLVILACGVLFAYDLYNQKKLKEQLKPATISVWYSAETGDDEDIAMQAIAMDFEQTFEGVKVELKAISPSLYETEIRNAFENDSIPNLFESSNLSNDILSNCLTVDSILESNQAKDCELLNQYSNYYCLFDYLVDYLLFV